MDKATFVKLLESVIRVADPGVERLRYQKIGGREMVHVLFRAGGAVHIDVTADSHTAMMRDVLRGIE